ncbi:MAG: hypothetical protein KJ808_00665 [Acidobacteria bacterium]|nr:hypothetical protein [Acidobacteriota bacterium]MBU4306634.1 hypothetical protein [Acidobacteriota bacterium]MBU4404712.1 hypothetical protein [Acidobacteriota bacterium]MCG2809983.1 hypothetical protein [Candidatus Aminicenantes bacterium]
MKKYLVLFVFLIMVGSLRAEYSKLNGIFYFGIDKWYGSRYYLFYEVQGGIEYRFSEKLFGEFYYVAMPNYQKEYSPPKDIRNSYAEGAELLFGYKQKLKGDKWIFIGGAGVGYQRYVQFWSYSDVPVAQANYYPEKEDYLYPLFKVGLENKLSERIILSYGLLKRFGKVEHFVILAGIKVSLF